MKVILKINFISLNHTGSTLYKIFLDNVDFKTPCLELEESSSLEDTLHRICLEYFDAHPKWILQKLSLVSVEKSDECLSIIYSCLIPELNSKKGKFIPLSNINNLTNVLNSLRMN